MPISKKNRSLQGAALAALVALGCIQAAGADPNPEPLAQMHAGGGAVVYWEPTSEGAAYDRLVLTVSGPDGDHADAFPTGEVIRFQVGSDGQYRYGLIGEYAPAGPAAPTVRRQPAAGQAATDENGRPIAPGDAAVAMASAESRPAVVQTGAFTVADGVVVDPNLIEE
jgi:hypothetical protein